MSREPSHAERRPLTGGPSSAPVGRGQGPLQTHEYWLSNLPADVALTQSFEG
jgi:hypothetical protein